jgi:hypothetical protein
MNSYPICTACSGSGDVGPRPKYAGEEPAQIITCVPCEGKGETETLSSLLLWAQSRVEGFKFRELRAPNDVPCADHLRGLVAAGNQSMSGAHAIEQACDAVNYARGFRVEDSVYGTWLLVDGLWSGGVLQCAWHPRAWFALQTALWNAYEKIRTTKIERPSNIWSRLAEAERFRIGRLRADRQQGNADREEARLHAANAAMNKERS